MQDKIINFKVMGDIRHSNADITKAQNFVGYVPTHNLYKGMQEAIGWYMEKNL